MALIPIFPDGYPGGGHGLLPFGGDKFRRGADAHLMGAESLRVARVAGRADQVVAALEVVTAKDRGRATDPRRGPGRYSLLFPDRFS